MNATVSWATVGDQDLAGYRVWHGNADGDYYEFATVAAGTTSYAWTQLDDYKPHHFAVSSFDGVPNHSAKSVNVSKTPPNHAFNLKY